MWLSEAHIRWSLARELGMKRLRPVHRAWQRHKIQETLGRMGSAKERGDVREALKAARRCCLSAGLWSLGWPCVPVSTRKLIRAGVLNA